MNLANREILDGVSIIFDTELVPIRPTPDDTDLYGSCRWSTAQDYTTQENIAALEVVGLFNQGDGVLRDMRLLTLLWGGTAERGYFDAPTATQVDLDTGEIILWRENCQNTQNPVINEAQKRRILGGLAALGDRAMGV